MNRQEIIEKIRKLEGLTDDERAALLELASTKKRYGLVWEDKPEDVEERLRDELPVLIEDKSKALTDGGDDAPNHILIEGDNLEALATLAYTHAGKIDVIYIDPPYNTGNKDFIYNDSYVDSEDTYRHSKWLSFMSKRLRIAKKLLSDRGVIFISIDDNEQANLKLLCDEVLGERNFISQFIWSAGRKNDSKYVSVSHEYIISYFKNFDFIKQQQIIWREKKQGIQDIYNCVKALIKKHGRNYDIISSELKIWYQSLPDNHPAKNHKHYHSVDERGIYFPSDISWPGGGGPKYEVLHPITKKPVRVPNRGWVYPTPERMQEVINQNLVHFGPDESSVPCKKTYLSDNEEAAPYSVFYKDGRAATKRLRAILNADLFQNPKDEDVLQRLFKFSSLRNSVILDFFAGSGTTLHAVMQLNAEDGGHRQCILVTNNENGICENVTYERNKRVINGYTKPNGEAVEGLHDNNLRYYRTDFVGRSRSPQNLRKLVRLATDMLCIKEDLYAEQPAFAGQEVVKQAFRYFEKGDKRMLVIYREEAVPLLVPLIEQFELPQGERFKVYVFSPSEDPWAGDFEDVQDKVELCALPMAILNAYKRVLPKRKDQNIFVDPDMVPGQAEENAPSDSLFPEMEGGDA